MLELKDKDTSAERVAQALDVTVAYSGGTIAMVYPLTNEARAWVRCNLLLEGWQWFGGGFVVEPRHVCELVIGMQAAGLVVDSEQAWGLRPW